MKCWIVAYTMKGKFHVTNVTMTAITRIAAVFDSLEKAEEKRKILESAGDYQITIEEMWIR